MGTPKLGDGNQIHDGIVTNDCPGGEISPHEFLRSIHIEIADACNERCIHCYIPNEHKNNVIDSALFYRIIEEGRKMNIIHVTLSGGEPLLQADFLCEFFLLAKEQHIHTTLDTAGQPFTTAEPFFSRLTTLLEHTDLVILDLKHIDPEKHRLLTGHSNESILSFARFLDQIHKPMWVRHVLVPGITDDPANLHGIRAFLDTLSNVEKVEILPYHTLGIYKWETLGIPYSLSDIRIPDENDLKRANQILLG